MNGPIETPCGCGGTLFYFGPADPLTPGDVDDRIEVQDQPPLPEGVSLATVLICADCFRLMDVSAADDAIWCPDVEETPALLARAC